MIPWIYHDLSLSPVNPDNPMIFVGGFHDLLDPPGYFSSLKPHVFRQEKSPMTHHGEAIRIARAMASCPWTWGSARPLHLEEGCGEVMRIEL